MAGALKGFLQQGTPAQPSIETGLRACTFHPTGPAAPKRTHKHAHTCIQDSPASARCTLVRAHACTFARPALTAPLRPPAAPICSRPPTYLCVLRVTVGVPVHAAHAVHPQAAPCQHTSRPSIPRLNAQRILCVRVKVAAQRACRATLQRGVCAAAAELLHEL